MTAAAHTSAFRRPIIAANWKMHKTAQEAVSYGQKLLAGISGVTGVEVVVCPPFTALAALGPVLSGSDVALGAQNVHWEAAGAYTGEISAAMLVDAGCRYVIIGHSERRAMGETDEQVACKVKAAAAAGLTPIVCVGERIEDRRAGRTEELVTAQVRAALAGVAPEIAAKIVVAYEPVWAIGTGEHASPAEAGRVIGLIRSAVEATCGTHAASCVRIQYGGSVNAENIGGFLAEPEIDGALVGSASLDAGSFARIVRRAQEVKGS
ncbi:MAG: triose-phosphate isomerase [Firmicutes bacterium]|nr:triose-phosphate isomerase [Bacillota bacterium]